MKTFTALVTIASVAGIGYYVGKKVIEKRNAEPKAFTEVKIEKTGDKVRKASMFAVGTLKTTADKIAEGINQVKNEDMVKKGEQTIEQVKDTTESIKTEIGNEINTLKNLVTSINKSGTENAADTEDEFFAESQALYEKAPYEDGNSMFEDADITSYTEDQM